MTLKGAKKGLLAIITFAVIALVVSYYFWESFLYTHYLGGYDQYGLPIQLSHPGFYFFIASWPIWLFPVAILLAMMFMFVTVKARKLLKHVHQLKSDIKEKSEALDAVKLELELAEKEVKKTQSMTALKRDHKDLEQEFSALMAEYQQSQAFIEHLLDKFRHQ
jgi:septal ring factor EnvC (AmiA/AmiB activator)